MTSPQRPIIKQTALPVHQSLTSELQETHSKMLKKLDHNLSSTPMSPVPDLTSQIREAVLKETRALKDCFETQTIQISSDLQDAQLKLMACEYHLSLERDTFHKIKQEITDKHSSNKGLIDSLTKKIRISENKISMLECLIEEKDALIAETEERSRANTQRTLKGVSTRSEGLSLKDKEGSYSWKGVRSPSLSKKSDFGREFIRGFEELAESKGETEGNWQEENDEEAERVEEEKLKEMVNGKGEEDDLFIPMIKQIGSLEEEKSKFSEL